VRTCSPLDDDRSSVHCLLANDRIMVETTGGNELDDDHDDFDQGEHNFDSDVNVPEHLLGCMVNTENETGGQVVDMDTECQA